MNQKVLRLTILSSHMNLASPVVCDDKMVVSKAILASRWAAKHTN